MGRRRSGRPRSRRARPAGRDDRRLRYPDRRPGSRARLDRGHGEQRGVRRGRRAEARKLAPLIECSRERGASAWPKACWLTSGPARALGLADRRVLAPGKRADVATFDLAKVGQLQPEMVNDFPGGAPGYIQRGRGHRSVAQERRAHAAFEIGAHALRATAATNALDHQADIAKVQEWLGHANIGTTRIYGHRRTRPEDSPTFKVATKVNGPHTVAPWLIEKTFKTADASHLGSLERIEGPMATSKKTASAAGSILRSPKSTSKERSIAGSILVNSQKRGSAIGSAFEKAQKMAPHVGKYKVTSPRGGKHSAK